MVNWRQFFVLWIASVLGYIASIPYFKATLFSVGTVQFVLMFGVMTFIGLYLARRLALDIFSWEKKVPLPSVFTTSLVLGVFVGIAIIILNFIFSLFGAGPSIEYAPTWQSFLVSFFGGISEEVMLRLFFVTLIAWVLFQTTKKKNMWPAISIVALLFALAHLPLNTAEAISFLAVVRQMITSGLAGMVFGWLYWKKGLESAMLAHFTTDIVLFVIFPLFLQ